MQGILITCNMNERKCTAEAFNLLNEYADKLYGPEKVSCFVCLFVFYVVPHRGDLEHTHHVQIEQLNVFACMFTFNS